VKALVDGGYIHNIVISPGPGTPERPKDIGAVMEIFKQLSDVPILGVCLGHQALAVAHGGRADRAPEPIHGRLSGIIHESHEIFDKIPSGREEGFVAVRYHSLIIQEASLPAVLAPICWTDGGHVALSLKHDRPSASSRQQSNGDRLLMGIAHRTWPHYGIQFHPESVATTFGAQLLLNFSALSMRHLHLIGPPPLKPLPTPFQCVKPSSNVRSFPSRVQLHLEFECIPKATAVTGASVMEALKWCGQADTFWLDSEESQQGRFSFLGGSGGLLWLRMTYRLNPPDARGSAATNGVGCATIVHSDGSEEVHQCPLREWVAQFLEAHMVPAGKEQEGLPFDFWGGLVGYVGYEMKAECGGALAHKNQCAHSFHMRHVHINCHCHACVVRAHCVRGAQDRVLQSLTSHHDSR
jgi:para-aminobenzoate synthetase